MTGAPRGGRPKFKPEYADQAYHLCLLGATNAHLAKALNVSPSTVEKWIAKKPEFAERIHGGRMVANAQIAESLFIRARGYSHPDVVVTSHQGHVTLTPITKYYPPDVRACEFWLKNRVPELWRDRKPEDAPDESQNLIQQAAERIMAADMEEWDRVLEEEGHKLSGAGAYQPMSEERKRGTAAKIRRARARHEAVDATEKTRSEDGSERADSPAPDLSSNSVAKEIVAAAGHSPLRSEEEKREFARMVAESDARLDGQFPPQGSRLEAVVSVTEMAEAPIEPPTGSDDDAGNSASEELVTPADAPTTEAPPQDFRAMLGLPPRHVSSEAQSLL